jgi:bifunctional hydroxylase/dehydrase
LLDLADDTGLRDDASRWQDRVVTVTASADRADLADLDAVLVRPDGYVAWARPAGGSGAEHIAAALDRWFGEPARG